MVWNGNPMAFLVKGAPALFMWANLRMERLPHGREPWSPMTEAVTVVDNPDFVNGGTGTDPVYKGLAIGNNSRDFSCTPQISGQARSRCGTARLVPTPRSTQKFIDNTIPGTFAPFGIHNINGQLWVTYAKQDATKHDPVTGAPQLR